MKNRRQNGFTLVEMLVTIVLIAVLGGLGYTCVTKAREKTRTVVEINAARNLVTGYLGYTTENSGLLLPGFKRDSRAANLEGESLGYPINARYAWRLAPSVPAIKGIMVYNGNEAVLEQDNRDYRVSVSTNMGLNATLVGGYFDGGPLDAGSSRLIKAYGKFFVSNLAEVNDPGQLIAFASARSGKDAPGYFEVRPPSLTGAVWASGEFSKDSPASSHGFVDFRWDKKAVVASLGGNVELLTESQLRDMRRWSNQASIAEDRDYTIRPVQ